MATQSVRKKNRGKSDNLRLGKSFWSATFEAGCFFASLLWAVEVTAYSTQQDTQAPIEKNTLRRFSLVKRFVVVSRSKTVEAPGRSPASSESEVEINHSTAPLLEMNLVDFRLKAYGYQLAPPYDAALADSVRRNPYYAPSTVEVLRFDLGVK